MSNVPMLIHHKLKPFRQVKLVFQQFSQFLRIHYLLPVNLSLYPLSDCYEKCPIWFHKHATLWNKCVVGFYIKDGLLIPFG